MAERKKQSSINFIREIVNPLWEEADLIGRSWGLKKDGNNPLFGSHILLGNEDNIVVIVENRKTGEIKIMEYLIARNQTPLGDKIRATLEKYGFEYNKENE